jgi:hypothetical protein
LFFSFPLDFFEFDYLHFCLVSSSECSTLG